MKRGLRWWDFAILAMVGLGCWSLAHEYRMANLRYLIFDSGVQQSEVAEPARPSALSTLQPGEFAGIAESMLFSPDRDRAGRSTPTPIAQPRSVALPRLFGVADLGDGPAALLATHPGQRAEWIRPGQQVGDFVLRSVSSDALVFLRSGSVVTVTPEELRRPEQAVTRPVLASRINAPAPRATRVGNASKETRPRGGGYRIGAEFRPGRFAADPNDGATDGTTSGGYVRRVRQSPFGDQHWWEREER